MQVYHRLEDIGLDFSATALAIGNFDGVHLGHQKLLASVLATATEKSLIPAVLSFFPHPVEVLSPGVKLERLTTANEKLVLLEQLGIQTILIDRFDHSLASLSALEFLEKYLARGLRVRSVHVGEGFRFGKARAGDTDLLANWSSSKGISLTVESALVKDGDRVSSSRIREMLRTGKVVEASALLGRPFSLEGQVIAGDGRGQGLGFPTANLRIAAEKIVPAPGVYFTRALWQRQSFLSVTNVGRRPTFTGGGGELRVEVHLVDFSAKLYDERVEVQFLQRIREEKKFSSPEALRAQIQEDIRFAASAAQHLG